MRESENMRHTNVLLNNCCEKKTNNKIKKNISVNESLENN